mgnify:CR=1 FL=1
MTWSLAMEEQFYLMLPFLVYFLPRRYLVRVCIAAILLAPVIRWILWELISWRATYHLTPARMDTIMWGVLIACTIRHEGAMAVLTKYRSAINVLIVVLYLYHQLFNLVVHRLVHDSLPHIAGWHEAYIPVIVLSLTFIAAELSYRFMERPILNRVRRTKYQFADELNTRAYSTA